MVSNYLFSVVRAPVFIGLICLVIAACGGGSGHPAVGALAAGRRAHPAAPPPGAVGGGGRDAEVAARDATSGGPVGPPRLLGLAIP